MEELDFFKRQFLLTTSENFDLPWKRLTILNYNLYYHPDLEFEYSKGINYELYLLGFIYDYNNPDYSNRQIINTLSETLSFEDFLKQLSEYSGHFVIIFKSDKNLILLNDAVAQHEVYYDLSFTSFATQPKLLSRVVPLLANSSKEALEFFSSSTFLSKKIYIGETTHANNILHLLPNHYINILEKNVRRYFPNESIVPISIYKASMEARKMLKGFIKAASLRHKLACGVTGGFDSRVLFLASIETNCEYYVIKFENKGDKNPDISVPRKLTSVHNRKFNVFNDSDEHDNFINPILDASVDFPRKQHDYRKDFVGHIVLNGNISEIARNDYGYYKKITPGELAILNRTSNCTLGFIEFEKWLIKNAGFITKMGYNVLDMFYWEERMAHWAAKGKTEMSALGIIVYSPFCSHKLLTTLLSTPRKYRDYYNNKLYELIIREFSVEAFKIPINPSCKNRIKKLLQWSKILLVIRCAQLKYRVWKTFGTLRHTSFKTSN